VSIESTSVLLAVGSNLGDRLGHLRQGLARLEADGAIRVVRTSSLYATDPVGAAGGEFLNAAVAATTTLEPGALLDALKAAERAEGRIGTGHDARPLDLDIVYYGDRVMAVERLAVPHPRRLQRAFVMVPAAEADGDRIDPEAGCTVREAAARLDAGGVRRVARPGWYIRVQTAE
jgi:2-amino-4-hydroxy-6-hydroxymethyldihydropteridine diphosphokinase